MSGIVEVTDQSFDADVIQSDMPVIVDFWAPWCGPCKMVAPLLEEAAKQFEGRIKVCKINVDDNNESAVKFGVRGIPTLIIFNNGQVEVQQAGALSQSQLNEFISSHC